MEQVPSLGQFSAELQRNGWFVLQIKRANVCPSRTCTGEHGEPAYCIVINNVHVPLNHYRLQIWAAAWVSGRVTSHLNCH
jgi:hypothetical protein